MRLKATWLAEDMIFEAGQRWISETEGPALVQLSSGEKGRRAVGSRLAASSRAVSFTGAFASVMMMYVPVYVTYVYTHARGKQETQINRSNNNSKQTMCIYIYIYYMCMCIIYIYIYVHGIVYVQRSDVAPNHGCCRPLPDRKLAGGSAADVGASNLFV